MHPQLVSRTNKPVILKKSGKIAMRESFEHTVNGLLVDKGR